MSRSLKDALSDAARELKLLQENDSLFLMSAIGGGGLSLDDAAETLADAAYPEDHVGVVILMDEMTGGDLADRVHTHGRLPEAHCKFYVASVLLGLEDLHSRCVLHRALKVCVCVCVCVCVRVCVCACQTFPSPGKQFLHTTLTRGEFRRRKMC